VLQQNINASQHKQFLPIANLKSSHFGADFDKNNRTLGFNAISGFDDIYSSKDRTIAQIKNLLFIELERFAELSDEVKSRYQVDETGQRGFTASGEENTGVFDGESTPVFRELREHIMLARPIPLDHPLKKYQPLFYRENILIDVVPNLTLYAEELLECLDILTLTVFENLEKYLQLPFGSIASKLVFGESLLRLHIYPAAEKVLKHHVLDNIRTINGQTVNDVEVVDIIYKGEHLANVLRAGPHSDMGFFTWLLGSNQPGLIIQGENNKSSFYTTSLSKLIGNVDDFLAQEISGYKASTHWVGLNPVTASKRRLSIANFVHPRPMSFIGDIENSILIYRRLHEHGYLNKNKLNTTIEKIKKLIPDNEIISEILLWEKKACNRSKLKRMGLGRYFHLVNQKTGKYKIKTNP
jgi:isopenicillin N synthase-like dioxygenase